MLLSSPRICSCESNSLVLGTEGKTAPGRCFGPTLALESIGTALSKENKNMLWTIFVILLMLWALGLVTSYTMGGMIHLLLVIALVVVVIRVLQGRSVV
jgi:uncharacterized protein DUF5670